MASGRLYRAPYPRGAGDSWPPLGTWPCRQWRRARVRGCGWRPGCRVLRRESSVPRSSRGLGAAVEERLQGLSLNSSLLGRVGLHFEVFLIGGDGVGCLRLVNLGGDAAQQEGADGDGGLLILLEAGGVHVRASGVGRLDQRDRLGGQLG